MDINNFVNKNKITTQRAIHRLTEEFQDDINNILDDFYYDLNWIINQIEDGDYTKAEIVSVLKSLRDDFKEMH